MNAKRKSLKLTAFLTLLLLICLVSCGKEESIEGKWVLTRQEFPDGSVYEKDSLKSYESYDIHGDSAEYLCRAPGAKKDITFTLTVVEISEKEYQFKINDNLVFTTGKLEGKKLKFEFDEGEFFYFEKEK